MVLKELTYIINKLHENSRLKTNTIIGIYRSYNQARWKNNTRLIWLFLDTILLEGNEDKSL